MTNTTDHKATYTYTRREEKINESIFECEPRAKYEPKPQTTSPKTQ